MEYPCLVLGGMVGAGAVPYMSAGEYCTYSYGYDGEAQIHDEPVDTRHLWHQDNCHCLGH